MSSDFRNGLLTGIVVMLLAIWALGLFGKLFAGETWLTLGFTDHVEKKRYCEVHPGVFHEWRWRDLRTFAGMHQNSHCEASAVFGVAWLPLTYQRFSAGGVMMALTGYDRPITPAPAPAIAYDKNRHGADLIYIPGVLVHLRYRWSFE